MTARNLLSTSGRSNSPMEKAKKLVELEALKREIAPQIEALRADLLETTKQLDVFQLKTGSYTISRVQKRTPKVIDVDALKEALKAQGVPFETKVVEVFEPYMKAVFEQFIKDGRKFDGLDVAESEYVMVRLAKKEEHE